MSARRTAHRRRSRRVGRGTWLAVLLVPAAVLRVVLKIVRLAQVPAPGPWWTRPADMVSDLTFAGARIVGWWVLAVARSRRLTRALVLAAAQLSTWAWSVLLAVYHEYWMRTGNKCRTARPTPRPRMHVVKKPSARQYPREVGEASG